MENAKKQKTQKEKRALKAGGHEAAGKAAEVLEEDLVSSADDVEEGPPPPKQPRTVNLDRKPRNSAKRSAPTHVTNGEALSITKTRGDDRLQH